MEQNDKDRTNKIATRLLKLTESHKIEWVKAGDRRYVYSSETASASISRDLFGTDIRLTIQNADGDTVSSASMSEDPSLGLTLENLYDLVERKALRVEETLDRFLKDLDTQW